MASLERRSSRLVHKSFQFELHEDLLALPNGRTMRYTRFEQPSFATVVPATAEGEIVFVENYRPPLEEVLLELPGGMMDEGESPEETARRELEEETGLRAGTLDSLGWFFPTPHLSANKGHIFIGRDLSPGTPHLEDSESLHPVRLSIPEAYSRLRGGQIHQSTTLLGLLLAEPYLRYSSLSK
jgi:ADP-ribose pyrophosphatase